MAQYREPTRWGWVIAITSFTLIGTTAITNKEYVIGIAERLVDSYMSETRKNTTRGLFDEIERRIDFMTPSQLDEFYHRSNRLEKVFEDAYRRSEEQEKETRRCDTHDARLY